MTNSREKILNRLRAAQKPFTAIPEPGVYQPMIPVSDAADLRERFILEAEKLGSQVHQVASEAAALLQIQALLETDQRFLSWEAAHLPLTALPSLEIATPGDPNVRVGLTGIDAAIAATGSLILISGEGKPRLTSLLCSVHIAVMTTAQIVPDLETWMAAQKNRPTFQHSSVSIISGPSRTGDIEMELVMGVHGPGEVHIILLP